MSVSWYAKLDASFHSNRKARKAGRLGRELFVFVLCTNAQRGSQGWIPVSDLEPWYLADQLQMTEDEAAACVTAAVTAGLIAIRGDQALICGWNEDYAKRPKTRAEIQKDYRERQSNRYDDEVTSYEQSNALPRKEGRKEERERVTAPRSLDSDLGPEQPARHATHADWQPSEAAQRGELVARQAKAARRGQSKIPSDWQPSDSTSMQAVAREIAVDYEHELVQFRLDARRDGKTFADPDAAFEKFMRGSRDKGKARSKPKPGAVSSAPRVRRVVMEGGIVVETHPDGTERTLAPDGTVIRVDMPDAPPQGSDGSGKKGTR